MAEQRKSRKAVSTTKAAKPAAATQRAASTGEAAKTAPKAATKPADTSNPKTANPKTANPKTANPTTTRKTPTSRAKPMAKPMAKPVTKPMAKATAKTTVRKAASPKAATASKAKSATIQDDLRKLEARLKRADGVTRKSVAALQTVVSTLDARLDRTTTAQKGQLTRHVNALSARLDDQTSKTREAVRAELRAALSAGGLDRMEAAVARAGARIDAAELAQADAVTRLNRHLADMARAVDARIAQEAADRARDIAGVNERLEAAIHETKSELGERVDGVERDSAEALTRVGETIERIHDKLETRRQSSADVVTEKVNELALQTQAEFEAYQDKLERRIGELEHRHAAIDPAALSGVAETAAERLRAQLEAQLVALQSRIEGLERGAFVPPTAANAEPVYLPADAPVPPYAAPQAPSPVSHTGGANDPNPYAAALPQRAQDYTTPSSMAPVERAPHEPVEFDPKAYARNSAQVVAFAPPQGPAQIPVPAPVQAPNQAPDQALGHSPAPAMPPMPVDTAAAPPPPITAFAPPAPVTPAPVTPAHGTPADDFQPAPLPDVPYANPAYAEGADDGSPKAVRISGDDGKRRRSRKPKVAKPARDPDAPSLISRLPVTGRNAKVAALMVGVSIVGLFAAKSILGTDGGPLGPDRPPVMQSPGTAQDGAPTDMPDFIPQLDETLPAGQSASRQPGAQPSMVDPTQATAAPIGQYEEARALKIDRAQMGTLQKAVRSGDPVAQFQMGLAQLEQGEDSDGAAMIRKAADQDLAVALYQLGKLHETGRGVDADPVRARQLIERAARSGNRIAMHDLALYHTEGRGGAERSMLTARSWFEQAAQRGVVDSQFNLAVLSETAESGLTPNSEDAYFWYTIAAGQGDKFAVERLRSLEGTLSDEAQLRMDARVAAFTPRPIDEAANGIFRDVPWLTSEATDAGRERTRTAQTLLARLGYPVGTPDGLMGEKTRTAITEFERASGLPETGAVSSALITRLEVAAGA